MDFRNTQSPRIVKNGALDAFTINTSGKGPLDSRWWSDTCFLVHALSDGDLSELKSGLLLASESGVRGLDVTARSVLDELLLRLCRLGYAIPGPETAHRALESETSGNVTYELTSYGIDVLPQFLSRQQTQMKAAGDSMQQCVDFAGNFLGMNNHHRRQPVDILHELRSFFASEENEFRTEPDTPMEDVFTIYETLGVVERTGSFSWHPTTEATWNAPFLLDILLRERSLDAQARPSGRPDRDTD